MYPVELPGSSTRPAPGRKYPAIRERYLVYALARMIGDERHAVIPQSRDGDIPWIPSLVRELANVVQLVIKHLHPSILPVDKIQIVVGIDGTLMW